MNPLSLKPRTPVEKRSLQLVKDKLAHTLDMLDVLGVSGAVAVCLFPDGASYLTSGGTCVGLRGATMALCAGLAGIRDLAKDSGDDALLGVIDEAVLALAPLIRVEDKTGVH